MDISEQSQLSPSHTPTMKERWKKLVEQHPTALIIGSFILLPFLIFGIVLLGLRIKNGSSSDATVTPTPTITVSPSPMTSNDEEEEEELEPTNTPAKTTPTKTLTPKPSSSATATPNTTVTPSKQANLYFHTLNCTYTASGSATVNNLENATIPSSSLSDSSTASCEVIFQNSEDVETGEIRYMVHSDNDEQKRADVGKLKKGNYPTSEFKKYTETVKLQKSVGAHELKFELNHDKTFPESKYDDNYKAIKYTVQ